jgi:hypothetical protein
VFYKATEKGVNQSGGGQAATLTIKVEAGLADPSSILLPDVGSTNCPIVPTTPVPHPAPYSATCPGGALAFSVQNTSDIPLRVTDVEQRQCQSTSQPNTMVPCPVSSDKNADGGWVLDGVSGSCSQFASFNPPVLNPSSAGGRQWPVIPAHGTLQVNGTDANGLGTGLLHLSNQTTPGCQGATFQVLLDVTAQDTHAFGYPF